MSVSVSNSGVVVFDHRVHFFGKISCWFANPKMDLAFLQDHSDHYASNETIKESLPRVDSLFFLMHHDASDLGLICWLKWR